MIKKTSFALAALVAGVSAQAETASKGSALSVTVDVTYVSDYVFRGQQLASDSIQPSVEAAYGDFYAGVWYSDDVSGPALSETDVYAGYGFAVTDTLKLDAGLTRYLYDSEGGADTTEAFVGASLDVILSPSLYYYYDFDRESNTVELSLGHSFPIDAIKASIDLSAKAGYVSKSGSLSDANEDYTYYVAGAAIPFKLSETATLTVGADYIINDTASASGFSKSGKGGEQLVGKAGISIGF